MKKFVFSLQRMLGFKRTVYEKERGTLAHMRAARAALHQRRDAAERQMLAKDAEFRAKAAAGGVRIGEVRSASFHRENADKLLKQMDRELAEMDVAIERQLQVVVELNKEVKSLEKLREAQWNEWQAAEASEERERILELVAGKFERARREAEEHKGALM